MHIPVLLNEVIEYLDPKAGENFVDCTIGQGGHASAILEKTAPDGKVLGIDLDKNQIENCSQLKKKFDQRLILANDNYANLLGIIAENNFININGILLDIGFSSFQIEQSKKGFSFLKDENLDMRYGSQITNAMMIVNEWDEQKIKEILENYGEEKFAKQIAEKIIEDRKNKKIETTFQLVGVIKKAVPERLQHGRINCATKTFQALRIAVNDELGNLNKVLAQTIMSLDNGGRLVVISFHSLEDRIVKNFFRDLGKQNLIKILTKKPITATALEISKNPRARSAKLRAVIKI